MEGLGFALLDEVFKIKNPEDIVKFLKESVSHEEELKILRSIDYSKTAKGQGISSFVHNNSYDGQYFDVMRDPPIVPNSPNCYRELILYQFYYEKMSLHKSIKTAYMYRSFSDGHLSGKPKSGIEGSKIGSIPIDDPTKLEVARGLIQNAYRANLLMILNKD
jgi:hypothetical protein